MTDTPTINTGLLVPPVNEQVSGALWEPWQGQELNEARNGITGKKVLPTRLTPQNLSWNKQSRGLLWISSRYTKHNFQQRISLFWQISGWPYLRPTTCPNTTPKAVKTADDREMAPLKCFGALSPKYMGCTFMLIPAGASFCFFYFPSACLIVISLKSNLLTHLHLFQPGHVT